MIDVRRSWAQRPRLADAAVAVAAAAASVLVARAQQAGLPPVYPQFSGGATLSLLPGVRGLGLPFLGCAALFWRRRRPVAVALGVIVVAVVSPAVVPLLVALFTVAVRCSGRATASIGAVALVPVLLRPVLNAVVSPLSLATAVSGAALVGSAVGWGLYVGGVRERELRAQQEAELRAEQARRHAREEIAREMHDVLAHRLTLLSMHAGALEFHPAAAPEQVAEAAGVIRQSASQALEDLQDVLRVLRAPTVDPHAEPPQPTLADAPRLIAEAREAGATVEVDQQTEDVTTMDPTTSRAAYRIVQEALTNHRKHAPRTPVRLTLTGGERTGLTFTAVNPVPPDAAARAPGSGQGLIGMSERARLAGGRMRHSHTAAGFRLEVWLPWTR